MSQTIELTPAQAKVLEFIRQNAGYYSPTVREIAAGCGWTSPNAAMQHIKDLEAKGILRRRPRCPRGIEILAAATAEVPHDG